MIEEIERSLKNTKENLMKVELNQIKIKRQFESLKPVPKLGKIGLGVGQSMMSNFR